MEWWQILVLASVGVLAGWLNVMAGGGSLLTIPLMLFMGVPGPVANGTNRIAILAQNISAVSVFFRSGFADLKLSFSLAAMATLGAIVGANLGVQLEGVWFNRLLALTMLGVLVVMWLGGMDKPEEGDAESRPRHLLIGHILMVGAGFWGGLIQVGVGFLLMPILHRVLGLNMVLTNMHKVTIVLMYTVVALLIYASQLELLWWAGLGLAAGNALGGFFGARTTIVHGDVWVKRVLYVVLVVFSIKLLFW
jgi:uncharacterized membrane protein YfcA